MCLGVPGRIVDIADSEQLHVTAEIQGVRRQISAALLGIRTADGEVLGEGDPADAVGVGDWVEVHLGFAMGRMDEAEAHEVLDGLRDLEETYERELAGPGSAAPTAPDARRPPAQTSSTSSSARRSST